MHRRDLLRVLGLSALAAGARLRALSAQEPVDVELVLTAAPGDARLLPGAATRVWRYTGELLTGPPGTLTALADSHLGPVIRLRRGQRVRIRFRNELSEESNIHWHGLDVPETSDGHPRLAVGHGREYVYEFIVTNRAGTYWYHPHPHMRTGAQVFNGLAGLLIVSDPDEDGLGLPGGDREIVAVLQDRRFDAHNQLVYGGTMMDMMDGVFGDRFLVSGQVEPVREVDAATYRLRLLNGSNARIYELALTNGLPFTVIGTDGGLLERPLVRRVLTLAPGQRLDTLVDLSAVASRTEIGLDTLAFPSADAGGRNGTPARLMTFRVGTRRDSAFVVPARFPSFDATWAPRPGAPVRRVTLRFQRMQWLLGDRAFEMEEVTPDEIVRRGSTAIWEFENVRASMGPGFGPGMGMQAAHPIHIHGRQFRVLDRRGGDAVNALREGIVDEGWADTVVVLPGEIVRVQVTFSDYTGLFMYHCHILEHEDMGMMRNFRVI